ncbi:unnamed protein product [Heterosigma akashiwo]
MVAGAQQSLRKYYTYTTIATVLITSAARFVLYGGADSAIVSAARPGSPLPQQQKDSKCRCHGQGRWERAQTSAPALFSILCGRCPIRCPPPLPLTGGTPQW